MKRPLKIHGDQQETACAEAQNDTIPRSIQTEKQMSKESPGNLADCIKLKATIISGMLLVSLVM